MTITIPTPEAGELGNSTLPDYLTGTAPDQPEGVVARSNPSYDEPVFVAGTGESASGTLGTLDFESTTTTKYADYTQTYVDRSASRSYMAPTDDEFTTYSSALDATIASAAINATGARANAAAQGDSSMITASATSNGAWANVRTALGSSIEASFKPSLTAIDNGIPLPSNLLT